MGHRFDNQSGLTLQNLVRNPSSFYQPVDPTLSSPIRARAYVYDCRGPSYAVFGPNDPSWTRGERGWGTIRGPVPNSDKQQTNFQVNSDDLSDVSEATADMFLNWVYRHLTDGAWNNNDVCTHRVQEGNGAWEGFRNITPDGRFDSSLSGNIRYAWMEKAILNIFNTVQW